MVGCRLDKIDFSKCDGLVPVIAIDYRTMSILTQAFANEEAVRRTVETGYAHFYSRSRKRLWLKGESSGNKMRVIEVIADCDCDSIVYLVEPLGPACHTGEYSCFHNPVEYDRQVYSTLENELWSHIVEAFKHAKIAVRRGYGGLNEYLYIVNPLTDNIPPPPPLLTSLLAESMKRFLEAAGPASKVVVPEALGLPIGSIVAYRLGLPLAVIRKREYPVNGVSIRYTSGYEEGRYYVYGVEKGDTVYLVDDAVSTGGTLKAVVKALEASGVKVVAIAASIFKPQYGALTAVEETSLPYWRAVDVYVKRDGSVRLVNPRTLEEVTLRVPVVEEP